MIIKGFKNKIIYNYYIMGRKRKVKEQLTYEPYEDPLIVFLPINAKSILDEMKSFDELHKKNVNKLHLSGYLIDYVNQQISPKKELIYKNKITINIEDYTKSSIYNNESYLAHGTIKLK